MDFNVPTAEQTVRRHHDEDTRCVGYAILHMFLARGLKRGKRAAPGHFALDLSDRENPRVSFYYRDLLNQFGIESQNYAPSMTIHDLLAAV